MRALKLDKELVALVNGHKSVHTACLQAGAIAAIAQGDTATARRFLARVVWQSKPDAESIRNARLAVIESYVTQGHRDDAYRSMLRLQQDIGKPDTSVAERFVSTLLRLGMEKDAINWMAALDEGPVKLRLRLRAGLAAPDAAASEARAAGAKSGDTRYWVVLAEAGTRANDPRLAAEGHERLLNAGQLPDGADISALWQAYVAAAREAANRQRLLAGDDAAWSDYGARQMSQDPVLGRAFFGYLSRQGGSSDARRGAQLQLIHGLQSAGLGATALRLFAETIASGPADLDTAARYLLADIADARDPAAAMRLREGLPPPPGITASEWEVRVALGALRAGDADTGVTRVEKLLPTMKTIDEKAADDFMQAGMTLAYGGRGEAAARLLTALAGRVPASRVRTLALRRAIVDEQAGRSATAAAHFLEAALLPDGAVSELSAAQARQRAAANLLRAGYLTDARTQLEWLVRNPGDPPTGAWARAELSRLRP